LNALVLGYGRSGKAAEKLLCRLGFSVKVLDGEMPFPDGDFAVAVVSPGIALSHPWIAEAQCRGIPLKSELQLGCETLRLEGWRLLAVTGSKGKSSVVKLVAEALGGVPCGNYGLPVCEVALARPPTFNLQPQASLWAVIEVSSFMMETTDLPAETFEAAAVLNFQEDHLDRHGTVEVYHGLKRKLLGMTRHPIDAGKLPSLRSFASLLSKSYFDNEILRTNGLLAIGLLRVAGLDDARIAQAFRGFVPLSHRMNTIAEIGGVRYIDDSKATSLAALVAGVKMVGAGVRLIAGGLPKGDDPASALPVLTGRVRKVYLIGQSAEAFRAAWKDAVDCEVCGTMDRAVERAKCEAVSGETVLLSPGAASFDQFKGFEERGEVFARLVKEKEDDK